MKGTATTLLEVVILLTVGTALGLGVNALRSDRLAPPRDYFKTLRTVPETPTGSDSLADEAPAPAPAARPTPQDDQPDQAAAGHGFQTITFQEAFDIVNDPMYDAGMCVFIDARDHGHYLEGHIPGAYLLDHYRLEQHLPDLLPVVLGADRVVVYCNGGDCEDSLFVCVDLLDAGVPCDSLYLYEGGVKEWQASGGRVERGAECQERAE